MPENLIPFKFLQETSKLNLEKDVRHMGAKFNEGPGMKNIFA